MIKNIKAAKILLVLSFIVFAFYLAVYIIGDVYRYPVVGAIFELLWLFMILALLVIPIISVIVIVKNRGKARVYAALSVFLILCAILIMTTQ